MLLNKVEARWSIGHLKERKGYLNWLTWMKYKPNTSSNTQGRWWIDHPDAGNSSCSKSLSCISHSWKKEESRDKTAVLVHSKIHKINSISKSRSAAIIYWGYSLFLSQRVVTASKQTNSCIWKVEDLPGSMPVLQTLPIVSTYPNILKTDLVETFSFFITGQPSLVLK